MIHPAQVTRRDILLATRRGFVAVYYATCSQAPTYRHAYETLEDRREQVFGERMFASYDSFRAALCRMRGESLPLDPGAAG